MSQEMNHGQWCPCMACRMYFGRQDQKDQGMCDYEQKVEKKSKMERLIEAIDRLERTISGASMTGTATEPADKLKAQIDRLEKLIG